MIELLAPAKLNLGLEILGRRDDGFHEIRSVMAPVSLVDTVRLARPGDGRLTVAGHPVSATDNLVRDAMSLASSGWGIEPVDASLTKQIPPSSGLGGGSSDAAATLLGMAHLFGRDPASLGSLAACLGSDVSFFLLGGSALVSGRGEVVTALPAHEPLHAVIVVPGVSIPRKTATMYASLATGDLTDGSMVDVIASHLPAIPRRREALPNAFRRALYDRLPELGELARTIVATTSLPANLTGAGPAHYVLCTDPDHAASVAAALRRALAGGGVSVYEVRTVAGVDLQEVADA